MTYEDLLTETDKELLPCRVEDCGEPFLSWENKLCVEHHMELMEIQQQDNKDEI